MPSSQDSTGAFLIDRSPKYFEPILCPLLIFLTAGGLMAVGGYLLHEHSSAQGELVEW